MNEPLALSLANTDLDSARDLDRWLRRAGGGAAEHAGELSLRLSEFGELRSCLRNLLAAAVEGHPLPADAVERLNETSERVLRATRLEGGEVTHPPVGSGPASLALARIAWSAMDVFGGDDRERLRRCGACGTFFVATRPDRVWCSDRCGNRIRVARHHSRLQGGSYPVRG